MRINDILKLSNIIQDSNDVNIPDFVNMILVLYTLKNNLKPGKRFGRRFEKIKVTVL